MEEKPGRDPKNEQPDDTGGSTQSSDTERGKELRTLAAAFEVEAMATMARLDELQLPLSTGNNLQEFPRPAPQLRAVEEGLEILRESAQRASAALAALAAAREQGLEISPELRAAGEPFISVFRAPK
jgi:hypothetical protein